MNVSTVGGGESAGVVFPASADGRRSTSALGRAVVADALRPVDAAGALGAEHETNWRSGYLVHDLHTGGGPAHDHPWQDEAYAAAPGGLWRMAYAPRSALGLAALLGYGAART